MPKWIHDRAMSLKKDMEKTYGPEKAEQVAFAVATQQAHKLGKSPKTFKSKVTGKKEKFGTPEGKAVAKAKFDKPRSEYRKTASEGSMTDLETNETQSTQGETPDIDPSRTEQVINGPHAEYTEQEAAASNKLHVEQETGSFLRNKGEKPTFKREHMITNMEKPNLPDIMSKQAMSGFTDEFCKIATARTWW